MPAGSLDPVRLDPSTVSDGPWDDDTQGSNDVQIEDADGNRVARVYKTSDLDSSSLPWQENKQLIQDALGYATQAAEREERILALESAVEDAEHRVENLEAEVSYLRRRSRRGQKNG